jgi:phage I-like protein
VDTSTLAGFAERQRVKGWETVAIDFEHETVPGVGAASAEPKRVAGYGTPVVREGVGIFLTDIQWTAAGREFACNYTDRSPVVTLGADGRVEGVQSVALCRQGAIYGLSFFSAADGAANTGNQTQKIGMNRDAILKLLGLPAEATDADVDAKVKALLDAQAAEAGAVEMGAVEMGAGEVVAVPGKEVKAMSAGAGAGASGRALSEFEAKVEQRLKAVELAGVKAFAAVTGRVIPSQVLPGADGKGGLELAALRALVEALPVSMPLTAHAALSAGGGVVALSAAEAEVVKMLGVSEADYRKHNGK